MSFSLDGFAMSCRGFVWWWQSLKARCMSSSPTGHPPWHLGMASPTAPPRAVEAVQAAKSTLIICLSPNKTSTQNHSHSLSQPLPPKSFHTLSLPAPPWSGVLLLVCTLKIKNRAKTMQKQKTNRNPHFAKISDFSFSPSPSIPGGAIGACSAAGPRLRALHVGSHLWGFSGDVGGQETRQLQEAQKKFYWVFDILGLLFFGLYNGCIGVYIVFLRSFNGKKTKRVALSFV